MAISLEFNRQKPSLTDPTTIACYNLALQTFDSLVSFDAPSWQRRIDAKDSMLFTASSESESGETSDTNNSIKGFLFTSVRQHPELAFPTFHISLAAVDPSHRGTGIFPRLLAMAQKYASGELGLGSLTVCTLPAKFPGMFRLLSDKRNGWVEVAWRDMEDGKQVLFRRDV